MLTGLVMQVLSPTEKLSKALQSRNQTIAGCKEAANFTLTHLEELAEKNKFASIWQTLLARIDEHDLDVPELSRVQQRKNPHLTPFKFAEEIYLDVISTVTKEIRSRFDQKDFKKYEILENLLLSEQEGKEEMETASAYGLSLHDLKSELRILKKSVSFSNTEEAVKGFKSLHPETQSMFPEVRCLLECLLVIPASSAEAERSFSTMRRVKSYLRSTMSSTRLNSLCVLSTYKELLDNVELDNLIDEFIKIKLVIVKLARKLVQFLNQLKSQSGRQHEDLPECKF
ncbi:uncharacterized protein DMENIID0001_144590 [Sergentomyia squamirostris]